MFTFGLWSNSYRKGKKLEGRELCSLLFLIKQVKREEKRKKNSGGEGDRHPMGMGFHLCLNGKL